MKLKSHDASPHSNTFVLQIIGPQNNWWSKNKPSYSNYLENEAFCFYFSLMFWKQRLFLLFSLIDMKINWTWNTNLWASQWPKPFRKGNICNSFHLVDIWRKTFDLYHVYEVVVELNRNYSNQFCTEILQKYAPKIHSIIVNSYPF